MKKLFVLMSMMFCIIGSAMAQKNIQAIGVHLNYGTKIESFSLGAKYQQNLTNEIRLEPSMNYHFEKKGVDLFDLNLNLHYIFPMASNIRLYPLAGLTFERWDFGKVKNRLGANIGSGVEFDIADNWMTNIELKYKFVKDLDQPVFSLGIAYMF
jgi:outer membrane protein X